MKRNLLAHFFLSLSIACLLTFIPVYSSALTSDNATGLRPQYPAQLKSLYQQGELFWQEKPLRDEFEKQIALLVAAGINDDLSDNYYQALQSSASRRDWPSYERLASDALLLYLSYTEQISSKGDLWLFSGKIDRDIGPPSKKSAALFFNATPQARLHYLQTLLPASIRQSALYHSFLLAYPTRDNSSPEKFNAFAMPGEKLPQKELLLTRLKISGDLSMEQKLQLEAQDKGLYSEELQAVIRAFQTRHGLKADAIIGEKTRYWLNIPLNERLRLMALNILRIPLWAANNPRVASVNIPDYRIDYWEEGKKTFTSKVIVGRVERKTALFSSTLNAVIFNPSWHVPVTIMRQDILPHALADREYFNKNHYQIIPSWRSKEVINSDKIEWETITVDNFPYKLRQKPGKTNALGLYKFNTPNKYAIYLHDTPVKKLFNNQYRAYSSGCIRIEEADKFALLLMEKSGFSEDETLSYLQQGKTQAVSLKKKITLHTIYQTVWVEPSGVMQFRHDIYGYDKLNRDKIPQKTPVFNKTKNLTVQ